MFSYIALFTVIVIVIVALVTILILAKPSPPPFARVIDITTPSGLTEMRELFARAQSSDPPPMSPARLVLFNNSPPRAHHLVVQPSIFAIRAIDNTNISIAHGKSAHPLCIIFDADSTSRARIFDSSCGLFLAPDGSSRITPPLRARWSIGHTFVQRTEIDPAVREQIATIIAPTAPIISRADICANPSAPSLAPASSSQHVKVKIARVPMHLTATRARNVLIASHATTGARIGYLFITRNVSNTSDVAALLDANTGQLATVIDATGNISGRADWPTDIDIPEIFHHDVRAAA